MKGDFSRLTFRQDKHYSSVRMQQGRVQLDADWNEQIDIQAHRDGNATQDTIGHCGGPLDKAGFALSVDANRLMIGSGHYYVDGILCENEADVDFAAQPDLPGAALPDQGGNYLAYLDVWQRHVTAVEDPGIREDALAGPDTATRTQTIWQVKLQKLEDATDCDEFDEDWEPSGAASTRELLRAWARPADDAPDGPCIVPPGAGYTRLENLLYRVEIHDGGEPYGARSQSAITSIQKESSDEGRVANDGQTWRVDQWVELFKDDSTEPGTLARITAVSVEQTSTKLTFDDEVLSGTTPPNRLRLVATFKFSRHNGAILARLEGITDNFVTVSDPGKDPALGFARGQRVELSDERRTLHGGPGVMVELASVSGNELEVVWPNATPLTMDDFPTRPNVGTPPTVRRWDSEGAIPLSTVTPWQDLEDGLQVGFGDGPYRSGNYWLIPTRTLGGKVEWPQDVNGPTFERPHGIEHRYCPLALLERANDAWKPYPTDCRRLFPPLTRLPANKIEYTPGGACKDLDGVTTVQEAIDELCKTGPGAEGITILDVRTVDPDATLPNDGTVPVSALAGGLRVACNTPVDPNSVAGKPTCYVTLEMPYPLSDDETRFWEIDELVVGYRPLTLRGDVNAEGESIRWTPAPAIDGWLRETLFEKMAEQKQADTILVHLTLKGNFIWATDDRFLFLDGEAVSVPRTAQKPVGLDLPSGDGRRGGDFEMWFWIKSDLTSVRSVELDAGSVTGGGIVQGRVHLHGKVTQAVVVHLKSSDPVAVFENGQQEIDVTVEAGTSRAEFQIMTSPVLISKDVTISAFSQEDPDTVEETSLRVQQPALQNVHCETNPVRPGGISKGIVDLIGVAPEGMELELEGDPERLVASLPDTVEVEEGHSNTEFEITVSTDAVSGEFIDITASYREDSITTRLVIS
jgi:hypothetical protein